MRSKCMGCYRKDDQKAAAGGSYFVIFYRGGNQGVRLTSWRSDWLGKNDQWILGDHNPRVAQICVGFSGLDEPNTLWCFRSLGAGILAPL